MTKKCFLYKKATVFCEKRKVFLSFCHSCFRFWLLLGLREKIILSTSIKFPFHCIFHCERLAVYGQLYNGMYREINISMFWEEKPWETTVSDTFSHFSTSWNGWWSITANNGGKLISKPCARIQPAEMNWTEVIPRHNISAGGDASTSREETRAFQWNIYNLGQQLVKQQHIRGQMRRWPAALQQSSETQHIYTQTKTLFLRIFTLLF